MDDVVRYKIDAKGITAHGEYIENVAEAFTLNENTGIVNLNFVVLTTMKGYFEFQIVAYDLGNKFHFIPFVCQIFHQKFSCFRGSPGRV